MPEIKPNHRLDARALIHEAFRIEGISAEDCRSIFLDWALGLDDGLDTALSAKELLHYYREMPHTHPMFLLLQEAAQAQSGQNRLSRRRRH